MNYKNEKLIWQEDFIEEIKIPVLDAEEVNKLFVETSAEKDELLKNLTNNSIIIEFKK